MYDTKTIGTINMEDLQKILPTPSASPINKRSRHNSYESIENVAHTIKRIENVSNEIIIEERPRRTIRKRTTSSSNESNEPKRSRGRPRRTEPIPIESVQNLHPKDRKYAVARLKNNEASRRSRLSRREKDLALSDELGLLQLKNDLLTKKDADLDAKIKIWQRRLIKLASL